MYSSHTIDSVTCLRLSSRCTAVQSGSVCRRWPRRVPGPAPALANSRTPSTASVTSSGNGQVSPAASNRRIVSRTVEGAVPIRRAISRVDIPADFNLITSRTWRIASLSVGIQVPFAKPKGGTISEPEEAASPGRHHPGMVGEIISEWRATSNRNGGRDPSGMVGVIERNQQLDADLTKCIRKCWFRSLESEMATYGYARVSTDGQSLTAQITELKAVKCAKIFQEKISGARSDRKQLARLLAILAKGDLLV